MNITREQYEADILAARIQAFRDAADQACDEPSYFTLHGIADEMESGR